MADQKLPDPETERVSMLWPKGLKEQVQTLVGKRKMTEFTVGAVQDAVRAKTHPGEQEQPDEPTPTPAADPHAFAAATPPEAQADIIRTEPDGATDLGTPISEHMLIAVTIEHLAGGDGQLAFTLVCRCGEQVVGISPNDDQSEAMARAMAKWEAKSEIGTHSAGVLRGRDVSAVEWLKDDPNADLKINQLQALTNTTVTVTEPDSNVTRIVGPGELHHSPPPPGMQEDGLPRIQVPYPDTSAQDQSKPRSGQLAEKILAGPTEETTARVTDIKERFGLQSASEIEAPPPPPVDPGPPWDPPVEGDPMITPGDRTVPGDLHFTQEPEPVPVETIPSITEAAPTASDAAGGMCPTCFSPLAPDGTCWSCAF